MLKLLFLLFLIFADFSYSKSFLRNMDVLLNVINFCDASYLSGSSGSDSMIWKEEIINGEVWLIVSFKGSTVSDSSIRKNKQWMGNILCAAGKLTRRYVLKKKKIYFLADIHLGICVSSLMEKHKECKELINCRKRVLYCGHSRGGLLALSAGAKTNIFSPKKTIYIVTIGAPRLVHLGVPLDKVL
jgi:hypothetical protein